MSRPPSSCTGSDRLAEQRPRHDGREDHLGEAEERREPGAEQADRLDAGHVGERGRDRADHQHGHPPGRAAAEERDVDELGLERHEPREAGEAEDDGAEEASDRGERDRRHPHVGALAQHVVDRDAEHRDARDDDAERVEGAAGRSDHEHQPRDRDDRAGEHDELRRPPAARPHERHERDRREVLDEQRRADRDAGDGGVEGELHAGHGDHRVDEHGPLRAPQRTEVELERHEARNEQDQRGHRDAEEHRGPRRPARLEQRLDDRAARTECEPGREAEQDPDDAA